MAKAQTQQSRLGRLISIGAVFGIAWFLIFGLGATVIWFWEQ